MHVLPTTPLLFVVNYWKQKYFVLVYTPRFLLKKPRSYRCSTKTQQPQKNFLLDYKLDSDEETKENKEEGECSRISSSFSSLSPTPYPLIYFFHYIHE
jgi:hypothetical protein